MINFFNYVVNATPADELSGLTIQMVADIRAMLITNLPVILPIFAGIMVLTFLIGLIERIILGRTRQGVNTTFEGERPEVTSNSSYSDSFF